MKSLVVLIAILGLCSSRLLLPSHFADVQDLKAGLKDVKVSTSCTVVKPADLGLKDGQVVLSGYMTTAAGGNSALAFIFYGSQQAKNLADVVNFPTVIWLNGGPGSSSQLGNFLELGPRLFQMDGKPVDNPHTWASRYNVMFVDQPVGSGYSYAATTQDIPTNQDQVGAQFVYAWRQFLTADAGCVKTQKLDGLTTSPWFVFGESYAGKYVPSIAQAALRQTDIKIPLKGIGIGDGFTDPLSIVKEMPSFGFNMGLIDYQERQYVERVALSGAFSIAKRNWLQAQKEFDVICDYITTQGGGVNVYDIFTFQEYKPMEDAVESFLNDPKTKAALGFSADVPYEISSKPVYEALSVDFMQSDCVSRVEEVLKSLPVIIYNGQSDLIVPNPGTMRWVYDLHHAATEEYQNKDFDLWKIKLASGQEVVAGYKKQAGNLEFRIVNQAGHLVPMDQPVAALDLLVSFVEAHKQ